LRIDEGVLGVDTKRERALNRSRYKIGVAHFSKDDLVVNYGTTSTEDGDFKSNRAQAFGVRPGRDPVVLVIKKHSGALQNVLDWLQHLATEAGGESERMIVRNVPLLLIDDEADNASINTKKNPDEVSAINGKIREILRAFHKSAYVGYTATPFANVFVNPDAQTQRHGDDIFPRSFIINVKPPSNYVGPGKVFGLNGDIDAGIPAEEGLPIIESIQDYAAAFPPKHKKDHVPPELPETLRKALRCFLLACAARRARGQEKKHNSMLIHVTRFVDVQDHVVRLVKDELFALQRRIEFGDGSRTPT
jgi:hypothetical protein